MTHTRGKCIEDVEQTLRGRLGQAECLLGRLDRLCLAIQRYCLEQNLKADYTACEILRMIDEAKIQWSINDNSI